MKTKEPMSSEKISTWKADELLKAYVAKQTQLQGGEPSHYKYIRESGVYSSLLRILIAKDPTYVMDQLDLISIRYEVHEVSPWLTETALIQSYATKEFAEWKMKSLSDQNPGSVYRLVSKIYEI